MFFRFIVASLSAIGFSSMVLANTAQPTHTFTLDNGLKVIVREDHRFPVAVSQVWYRVGSSFESPGSTGLSHMLEHMMFKGSRKVGAGEASNILRELGVQENAFTTNDVTVYYQELAKDRLPVVLELEADRMANLALPKEEFLKELDVVKEERRLRTDDNPNALAYERFLSLAYPASGYHNPTVGWRFDLDRMTIDDLKSWYQRWYAPNNAILVIVGDVELDEVKRLVNRWFAKIPKNPTLELKSPLELSAPGERRLTVYVKTQLPSLIMGFNVPSLATAEDKKDVYVLELISGLLDGGDSARLVTQLEYQQELVTGVGAGYSAISRGDTLFRFSALPNTQRDKTVYQVEKGIWGVLSDLKKNPPTQDELDRVKVQLKASLVYAKDSISNQAITIGYLESVGLSWQLADQEIKQLEAITPEDIQRVAKKYFVHERATVAYVLPEEKK